MSYVDSFCRSTAYAGAGDGYISICAKDDEKRTGIEKISGLIPGNKVLYGLIGVKQRRGV